jgi:uncharacterized protein
MTTPCHGLRNWRKVANTYSLSESIATDYFFDRLRTLAHRARMRDQTISSEELQRCQQTARRQWQRQQARERQARQQAWQAAVRAVEVLKSQFGATRVIIFGSLVRDDLFHVHSDVDIAVAGVADDQYYRAVGVAQGIAPGIAIDVIRLEDAPAALQRAIAQEGTIVL